MYKILFRVEAYEDIALGHLTRCISLAHTFSDLGCEITFILFNDNESIRRVRNSGFLYVCKDYKIDNKTYLKDANYIRLLTGYDILVVDSYQLNHEYFSLVSESFKQVVYIDDLNNNYPVDIVVNSSCRARKLNYTATLTLLGMKYIILDKYYWNMPKLVSAEVVGSIMITMGGVDHYDYSSTLLSIIENIRNDITVHIVIGPYYTNIDSINTVMRKSNLDIKLHFGLNNISEVIEQCDIAISGGGFTIYELAAAAIPSIGISLWENQNSNIKCLASYNAILPVYHKDNSMKEIGVHISNLVFDYNLRCSLREAGRRVLDGQGARRIARSVLKKISL